MISIMVEMRGIEDSSVMVSIKVCLENLDWKKLYAFIPIISTMAKKNTKAIFFASSLIFILVRSNAIQKLSTLVKQENNDIIKIIFAILSSMNLFPFL